MNIDQIKTECFILALFIREDGERILLGSGEYEFKGSQLHFAADSYANDVVEVQGNDGVFLAGQVRRPSSQVFDGYIGDATVRKPKIEEYRRHFLAFFRKNYYYTVVYIFPDGTAIQRRKGFIVDAPEVKELYQVHPEYHIALNFEDVNYYSYSEDESGQETYTKSALINLSTGGVKGGLVWDAVGAVNLPYTWTDPVEFTASDMVINNALDVMVPLEGMELRGDTFQQTYSGKNLFPLGTGSYTNHGFTSVYNADGSITVSGTADATYADLTTTKTVNYEQGKTYTISITEALPFGFGMITLGTGSQREDVNIIAGNKSGNRTLNYTHNIAKLYIYNLTVGQSYSFTVYPMFEEGSTASPFEPYVGGTASPNPDYPQNVNTVTGEQTVSVVGKNLFDGEFELGIINGSTGLNGANSNYIRSKNYVSVQENTTYIISSPDYTGIWFVYEYDGNKQYNLTSNKSTNGPFTTSSGTRYVRFRPNAQIASAPLDMKVQLESGSTSTDYEPYQSQEYEVNLGKNLFDKNGEYIIGNGNPIVTQLDTGIKMEYNTTGAFPFALWIIGKTSDFVGKTLTASADVTKSAPGLIPTIGIGLVKADGSSRLTKSYISGDGSKKTSWTVAEDGEREYVFMSLYATNNGQYSQGDYTEYNNAQIEVGSTATSYAPYIEPIELCKIDDYQDYFYKNDGSWYLHKAVGKVVLDGTESWNKLSGTAFNTYYVDSLIAALRTNSTKPYLSNNFTPITNDERYIDQTFFINSNNRILMSYNAITSNADWKTWLSTHNTTIYYALATPTDTQITDETLLNQLNAIGATRLFVGQNNISVQSAGSNLPVLLKASYATGLDTAGAGFEWEEGGSGGPTTVMVDSIDRVYPVWRLTGPAVNPQLAVLETGTILSYTGTITASQTLEIDMFNKTAKLNGTSVIGNVSGDWVYFRPGNNRVSYTTNNADALPSMIYWQEVVG